MKILPFAVLFFIACLTLAVPAQCTKTSKELPSLRGIKLDMPLSEVEKLHQIAKKPSETSAILIAFISFDDAEYTLHFRNNKVIAIYVSYEERFPDIQTFRQTVSTQLSLPDFWEEEKQETLYGALKPTGNWIYKCSDFSIQIAVIKDNAYFRLEKNREVKPFRL